MQGIYTNIPETNHVLRGHRVAAILVLLFMVLILLVPALNHHSSDPQVPLTGHSHRPVQEVTWF
jgi:preprotein translocase subunit SecG